MQSLPLPHLPVGASAVITRIETSSPIRRRLQEIGFTKGAVVECMFKSPLGDPTAYKVKNTIFALRQEDASCVYIEM